MENLAGMIRKAGKVQRTSEFLCPYIKDFYVSITYASKMILTTISDASREVSFNTRTKEREERLNDDKLRNEYVDQIIRDWRGLTPRKLKKLVLSVECSDEDIDKEINFSKDVAIALMEVSTDFEAWIIDTAINTENFTEIEKVKNEEFENLEE